MTIDEYNEKLCSIRERHMEEIMKLDEMLLSSLMPIGSTWEFGDRKYEVTGYVKGMFGLSVRLEAKVIVAKQMSVLEVVDFFQKQ